MPKKLQRDQERGVFTMISFKHRWFQTAPLLPETAQNDSTVLRLRNAMHRPKTIAFLLFEPLEFRGPMFHHGSKSLDSNGSSLTTGVNCGSVILALGRQVCTHVTTVALWLRFKMPWLKVTGSVLQLQVVAKQGVRLVLQLHL